MKISIVMRFHDDTASGGRKIIYEYANYLAEKGHNVEITFLADTPYKQRKFNFVKHAVRLAEFFRRKSSQKSLTWFDLNASIRLNANYSLKKNTFKNRDIIIATDFGIALNVSRKVEELEKIIYFIQADEKLFSEKKIVDAAWELPIQKIVVSSWLYDMVRKHDNKVILVKNYVKTESFYIEKPVEERGHVISLLNHPSTSKDVLTGIKALKIVHDKFPDLKVIFFGNPNRPNDLPECFEYIQKADEKVLRSNIYNQSSIFLFTSRSEGWGLVATEAMASGAALVSTRNGGVNDFGIDGETALLSDVGDFKDLANKIIRLLENDDMRIKLAKNGANLVNTLTFESSANEFEKVLESVANQ